MSSPSSTESSSSEDGGNLLRGLLKEPLDISPQRPKPFVASSYRPSVYPTSSQPIFPIQHYVPIAYQHPTPQRVSSVRPAYKFQYHYSCYAPIPMHILFNTSHREFDFDDYLPQSDLYYLRESRTPDLYDKEQKKRKEEEKRNEEGSR